MESEIKAANVDLKIFPTIGELYALLAPDAPERDTKLISQKIAAELGESVVMALSRFGFTNAWLSDQHVLLKTTSDTMKQFGTFVLTFSLSAEFEEPVRLEPKLALKGNCVFDVASGEVGEVNLETRIISWTAADGERVESKSYYLRGSPGTLRVSGPDQASTAIGFV